MYGASVQVIYASPASRHSDAAFEAVVRGGYLDRLPGMSDVRLQPPTERDFPPGQLSNATVREAVRQLPRGTLYVVVLGPEQTPEPQLGGLYPYHQESDDGRYAVLPARDSDAGQAWDFAHELVEGLEDAEIVDPCAYDAVQYGPWRVQPYLIGGQCVAGEYSRPREKRRQ